MVNWPLGPANQDAAGWFWGGPPWRDLVSPTSSCVLIQCSVPMPDLGLLGQVKGDEVDDPIRLFHCWMAITLPAADWTVGQVDASSHPQGNQYWSNHCCPKQRWIEAIQYEASIKFAMFEIWDIVPPLLFFFFITLLLLDRRNQQILPPFLSTIRSGTRTPVVHNTTLSTFPHFNNSALSADTFFLLYLFPFYFA